MTESSNEIPDIAGRDVLPESNDPRVLDSKAFSEFIDSTLARLGLTNAVLSEEFPVSVTSVERWRAGESTPRQVARRCIVEFLDLAAETHTEKQLGDVALSDIEQPIDS